MTEYKDYLAIEEDDKGRFGVVFQRTKLSQDAAIRIYRKLLKMCTELEEEDIKIMEGKE